MRKLKDSRRPEILGAALALADERGLAAVSMRAVAQRLGLTPMALYGYFRNKEELLDGVLGQMLSEVELPADGIGWREALERLAYGVREIGASHPAAFPLLLARPAVSPAALRLVEAVYRLLLAAGVPPQEVPRLERMLGTFVLGHVTSEVSGRFGAGTLDPAERRAQFETGDLPGHEAVAGYLDHYPDAGAEFRANLDDVMTLVERAVAR
ncbi:TetR/AcrR family transcriptional regulator [Actinoplanes sp. NPDC051411]|uniref:TetR/AcrR family transcriptional regulator n=1 Tax=Actinoplanes sp. NPDC051411 TaxID=3155522 RepID=UPI0034208540